MMGHMSRLGMDTTQPVEWIAVHQDIQPIIWEYILIQKAAAYPMLKTVITARLKSWKVGSQNSLEVIRTTTSLAEQLIFHDIRC